MKKNYLFTLVLMFATQIFWAQIAVVQPVSFSSCVNIASDIKTFVVSDNTPVIGVNITVDAPTGFEVSLGGTTFSAGITIVAPPRIVGGFQVGSSPIAPTTVYIRMKAHTTSGSKTGNVSIDGGNLRDNRDFTVAGIVYAGPATPTITASSPTTFCAGGSVVLTSSSTTGSIWSTGETTRSITVSSSITESVVAINANGCRSASSTGTVVTVNPLPTAPMISTTTPTTFCQGGSVVLTSSAFMGNRWSNGATTQSTTVSTAGMYTVTTTDTNGCTSTSSTATTVSVNALAKTPAITTTGNATVCEGEAVVLNCDESASPSSTYTWYKDGRQLQSGNTKTYPTADSGMYTVIVNNGVCNSLPSPARKVTVNPRPENPTIFTSGPTGLCSGGSVILTSSSTTGNLWSTGAITPSITVSTAGTYTLTVTNSFGCTSRYDERIWPIDIENEGTIIDFEPINTASVTVTVNQAPLRPVIIAEGPTSFCAGGSVTLTTLSETPITWSNGSTESSITVDRAGTYTAKTDIQGCFSQSSLPKTIVVNALPTKPTITAVGSPNLAPGKSVLLTSSVSSGNTWSTNAKTRSITVKSAGSYSVSVSSTKGCTATSEPFIVTSGSTNTSKVASDNSKKENSNAVIRVYPNPSKGIFNIDSDENGEVSIVNILGQSVKTVKVKAGANNTVNAENLSNGVYFVRNANTNKSSKLIINK